MKSFSTLLYKVADGIAEITLNRPEAGHAFDKQMGDDLYDAWLEIANDNEVLGVIITASGRDFFTSGADLKAFARGDKLRQDNPESFDVNTHPINVGLPEDHPRKAWPDRPAGMWKPVMLAINGKCLGGGWHLLWQTDFAICSDNATFFDTHVSIGWIGVRELIGASTRMPFGHTMRLFLGGRDERMSAEQALQCGLVTEVVPFDELMPRAREIMGHIVANAPLAVRATAELMHRTRGVEFEYSDMVFGGTQLRANIMHSDDYHEGPRAFAEKRAPVWRGR